MPLRVFTPALCVAIAYLLMTPAVCAQAQPEAPPNFKIEVHAETKYGPAIKITNLSGKPITALVLEISSSSLHEKTIWVLEDYLVLDIPPVMNGQDWLELLSNLHGFPTPDGAEVIAGVWAGGEAFGQPESVKGILQYRKMRLRDCDEAIAFLQEGLDEVWSRDRYLVQLDLRPEVKFGLGYEIRQMLEKNPGASDAKSLHLLIETMLEKFQKNAEEIRQSLETKSPSTAPSPAQSSAP